MAKQKKAKVELTLEELQAKRSKKQRGWVRFCAILLAVVLTLGIYGMASKGDPKVIKVYPNMVQPVVVRTDNGQSTDTDTPAPDDSDDTTQPPATSEESGGILDMLMGLLGGLDLSGLAGNINIGEIGVTIASGIDTLQESLLALVDRLEESISGKPVIEHETVEYGFPTSEGFGSLEDRQQVASLLNSATAAAQDASYTVNRMSDYMDGGNVSIGEHTATLNSVLGAAGLTLDSAVGALAGVGSATGRVTPNTMDLNALLGNEYYALKATSLKAEDIQLLSADANTGTYELLLKNVDDPNRRSDCGLTRFTDDYLVQNEIATKLKETAQINNTDFGVLKLTDLRMSYSNIYVAFQVDPTNNQLVGLQYSYIAYGKFTVRTNAVQVVGAATTGVDAQFSAFDYTIGGAVTG